MNLKSAFQRRFILIVGMIVLIFLLGIGFVIQQSLTAEARGIPTSTIPLDPGIIMLQNQLQSNNMSDDSRHSLETKVAVELYYATRQAKESANLPAYRPTVQFPIQIPATPTNNAYWHRSLGIIDNPSVPFPAAAVIIENGWQEKLNDDYVIVLAGANGEDPTEGILIIMTENTTVINSIDLPGYGSIMIIDFKGNQLVLQSKNKGVLYFDVAGQSFIKSLGEIVPTITPIPTYPAITYPYP